MNTFHTDTANVQVHSNMLKQSLINSFYMATIFFLIIEYLQLKNFQVYYIYYTVSVWSKNAGLDVK